MLVICSAQNFERSLKEDALKIEKPDQLSDEIYNALSDYRLIMVGEMHGTNESAEFVTGLAKLFSQHGDSVQVGFEIPSDQMKRFLESKTDSTIYSSDFFAQQSPDGRASAAWANAISRLNKTPAVTVFFFDMNGKYDDRRDSTMYLNVKHQMKDHPKWKTLTISGNVHNMLLPYKGLTRMGGFLVADAELNVGDKTCSFDYFYQSGKMNGNFGDGLKLHDVGNVETKFSKNVSFENYLFIYPALYSDRYNAVFFTRQMTASKLAKDKQ